MTATIVLHKENKSMNCDICAMKNWTTSLILKCRFVPVPQKFTKETFVLIKCLYENAKETKN